MSSPIVTMTYRQWTCGLLIYISHNNLQTVDMQTVDLIVVTGFTHWSTQWPYKGRQPACYVHLWRHVGVQYLSPMTLEMGLTQPFNCIKKDVPNTKAQILGNNGLKVMLAFRTNMPGDNQVRVSATKGQRRSELHPRKWRSVQPCSCLRCTESEIWR